MRFELRSICIGFLIIENLLEITATNQLSQPKGFTLGPYGTQEPLNIHAHVPELRTKKEYLDQKSETNLDPQGNVLVQDNIVNFLRLFKDDSLISSAFFIINSPLSGPSTNSEAQFLNAAQNSQSALLPDSNTGFNADFASLLNSDSSFGAGLMSFEVKNPQTPENNYYFPGQLTQSKPVVLVPAQLQFSTDGSTDLTTKLRQIVFNEKEISETYQPIITKENKENGYTIEKVPEVASFEKFGPLSSSDIPSFLEIQAIFDNAARSTASVNQKTKVKIQDEKELTRIVEIGNSILPSFNAKNTTSSKDNQAGFTPPNAKPFNTIKFNNTESDIKPTKTINFGIKDDNLSNVKKTNRILFGANINSDSTRKILKVKDETLPELKNIVKTSVLPSFNAKNITSSKDNQAGFTPPNAKPFNTIKFNNTESDIKPTKTINFGIKDDNLSNVKKNNRILFGASINSDSTRKILKVKDETLPELKNINNIASLNSIPANNASSSTRFNIQLRLPKVATPSKLFRIISEPVNTKSNANILNTIEPTTTGFIKSQNTSLIIEGENKNVEIGFSNRARLPNFKEGMSVGENKSLESHNFNLLTPVDNSGNISNYSSQIDTSNRILSNNTQSRVPDTDIIKAVEAVTTEPKEFEILPVFGEEAYNRYYIDDTSGNVETPSSTENVNQDLSLTNKITEPVQTRLFNNEATFSLPNDLNSTELNNNNNTIIPIPYNTISSSPQSTPTIATYDNDFQNFNTSEIQNIESRTSIPISSLDGNNSNTNTNSSVDNNSFVSGLLNESNSPKLLDLKENNETIIVPAQGQVQENILNNSTNNDSSVIYEENNESNHDSLEATQGYDVNMNTSPEYLSFTNSGRYDSFTTDNESQIILPEEITNLGLRASNEESLVNETISEEVTEHLLPISHNTEVVTNIDTHINVSSNNDIDINIEDYKVNNESNQDLPGTTQGYEAIIVTSISPDNLKFTDYITDNKSQIILPEEITNPGLRASNEESLINETKSEEVNEHLHSISQSTEVVTTIDTHINVSSNNDTDINIEDYKENTESNQDLPGTTQEYEAIVTSTSPDNLIFTDNLTDNESQFIMPREITNPGLTASNEESPINETTSEKVNEHILSVSNSTEAVTSIDNHTTVTFNSDTDINIEENNESNQDILGTIQGYESIVTSTSPDNLNFTVSARNYNPITDNESLIILPAEISNLGSTVSNEESLINETTSEEVNEHSLTISNYTEGVSNNDTDISIEHYQENNESNQDLLGTTQGYEANTSTLPENLNVTISARYYNFTTDNESQIILPEDGTNSGSKTLNEESLVNETTSEELNEHLLSISNNNEIVTNIDTHINVASNNDTDINNSIKAASFLLSEEDRYGQISVNSNERTNSLKGTETTTLEAVTISTEMFDEITDSVEEDETISLDNFTTDINNNYNSESTKIIDNDF